ncbi:MAG: GPW/gp25 family protein [Anaerolineae bacterium]|nr:GPW/gp25 family protein [Anaerolineae bacterium]
MKASGLDYSAWRFHFSATPGQHPPGLHIDPVHGTEMVQGAAAVRQALLLLIATRPGERVMRPDYGCNLQQLMFMPNDETTAGLAIHYVEQAITRFEPRVEIVELDANPMPDRPNVMFIELQYRIKVTQAVDQLAVTFDLASESIS